MIVKTGIVFLGILASSAASSQSTNCLSYEPTEVKIVGKVVRETFPGPPNYESIREGDQPEVCWIVTLEKQVCISEDKNNDINEAERDVSEIQLVLNPKHYQTYRHLLNRRVVVSGTLFHAHTGHHHKAVLITVARMVAGQPATPDER